MRTFCFVRHPLRCEQLSVLFLLTFRRLLADPPGLVVCKGIPWIGGVKKPKKREGVQRDCSRLIIYLVTVCGVTAWINTPECQVCWCRGRGFHRKALTTVCRLHSCKKKQVSTVSVLTCQLWAMIEMLSVSGSTHALLDCWCVIILLSKIYIYFFSQYSFHAM